MVGLGLGGGHGRMQGLYGLVSDNILSARLVVANGSLITVSAGRNSDLFWALRGAGHNFGVVVEFESKIYDRTDVEEWKLAEFVFDDEKLEDVFSFLEEYRNGFQSKETTIFVSFVSYLDIMDPLSNVCLFIAPFLFSKNILALTMTVELNPA
jgi:FAD/FMN-containing dehydrogenase